VQEKNNIYLSFVATHLHSHEFCSESLGERTAIAERVFKKTDKKGSFYNNSFRYNFVNICMSCLPLLKDTSLNI